MAELAHLAALTPRDRRVILGLAAVSLAPADCVASAYFPSERSARARIQTLVARGIVESLPVYSRAVPGARSAHLLALSQQGSMVATALGGQPISRAQLEAATVLAESIAVISQAFFSVGMEVVEDGGKWVLRPDEIDLQKKSGLEAPAGAWSMLRNSSNKVTAVFDVDLPGRSPGQVSDRLKAWVAYRAIAPSVRLIYVVPDAERIGKLAKTLGDIDGVFYREHPVEVARTLFGLKKGKK